MKKKNLGQLGEDLAVKHLRKNKYKILERNFRSRLGEIDVVAKDGDVLVFVEVKTRWSKKFGPPEAAITPWKIRHIIKAGQYYKFLYPKTPEAMRLDAVAVDLDIHGAVKEIRITRNLTG